MRIDKLLIFCFLAIVITIGSVSATDNATQNDFTTSYCDTNQTNTDIILQNTNEESLESDYSELSDETTYDNKYYLFRGDCWTIANNFESSAAVTSETIKDLTVSGTFRTKSDLVGLYWNSQDPIQHPYISYGNHSDYTDVILEFDYEMSGCTDFSNDNVNFIIETNSNEIYYLKMNRFIENNHLTLDFNNLTLLPYNTYFNNNQPVVVTEETHVNVTDIKSIMFSIVPDNYVADYTRLKIMENKDFTCKISNIKVTNGEIGNEQPPLQPHKYRLCEGYDDIYSINPLRLSKEMKKLGYTKWINFYIGTSYFYEKNGIIGDAISEVNFNHERTEKMVLNKNIPLNKAFKSWLDCYCRELKNNGVENFIISVSMENLQCPQSWRQMDSDGNYAMTGWTPSTFFYSPCNEEVIFYMQNLTKDCHDIVADNGLKPILQIGETWWWWNETSHSPCFYDNATKSKYLSEHNTTLPIYSTADSKDYNETVGYWLNHQLVNYNKALGNAVKTYNRSYMALFFTPSVIDSNRVPKMMKDANYIYDAYSPSELEVLQIEDYDWVIYENPHHNESYTIGQDLGFSENRLHYFGGFVRNPEDASKFWPLIEKAMDYAVKKNFSEVFVWAGTQVRRDNKILGYDEDGIIKNLTPPTVNLPVNVSVFENFTITVNTQEWINGNLDIFDYNNGKKGKLLASKPINKGFSSVQLLSTEGGLNRFYLEFNYFGEKFHLIEEIYINKLATDLKIFNTLLDYSDELIITLTDEKNKTLANKSLSININGTNDIITTDNSGQAALPMTLIPGNYTADIRFIEESKYKETYANTNIIINKINTCITASNISTTYNVAKNLVVTLKDENGHAISRADIIINLNNKFYKKTTDTNGQVKFSTNLPVKSYIAKISFEENDIFKSSALNVKITFKKATPKLTAKSKTFKAKTKVKKITATLKTNNNKAMKKIIVKLTLNKKTYKIKTNSKGIATFKVKLTKKGKYSGTIQYTGNSNYKSVKKIIKIIIK